MGKDERWEEVRHDKVELQRMRMGLLSHSRRKQCRKERRISDQKMGKCLPLLSWGGVVWTKRFTEKEIPLGLSSSNTLPFLYSSFYTVPFLHQQFILLPFWQMLNWLISVSLFLLRKWKSLPSARTGRVVNFFPYQLLSTLIRYNYQPGPWK